MLLVCHSRNSKQFLNYVNDASIIPEQVVLLNCQEWQYTSIGSEFSFDDLIKYVNKFEIPLYIINGTFKGSPSLHDLTDMEYRNVQPIQHYPYFIKMWWEQFDNDVQTLDEIKNNNFKYLYISLNGKSHPHRCAQIDYLAKYDLIKYGAISWNSPPMFTNSLPADIAYTLEQYNFKYWEPEVLILDSYEDQQTGFRNRLPTEYRDSFMQLISEATVKSLFITEKTVPALMKQKIFLVSSAMHFYRAMKNYGFELYDEIFDYSFDHEPNDDIRFELIAQNIDRLKTYTNEQLQNKYQLVWNKLVHNRNRCIELGSNADLLPQFSKDFFTKFPNFKEWTD